MVRLFIFILTHAQKMNYKLISTNISENYKTSKRKKLSKLFFNDMTNIEYFDPSLLNIDRVSFESDKFIIYDIKYIKDLTCLNSLYLVFNNLDAYIEKSGENKYLIFASTDKNGEALENYPVVWDEIKEQIELITGDEVIKNGKDFMKTKFESNDGLPLGKILNIPMCVIIVRSILEENNKCYPQVLLHECFYEYEKKYKSPSCVKCQLRCKKVFFFMIESRYL